MKLLNLLLIFSQLFFSQSLQLEEIMKGDGLIGNQPENHRWSWDGNKVFFEWNPKGEPLSTTYYWMKGMTEPKVATVQESSLSKSFFLPNSIQSYYFFVENNSLKYIDINSKRQFTVFRNSKIIQNIYPSLNPNGVFFQQDNNIFSVNLEKLSVIQVTNFSKEKEENKSTKLEDSYLKKQQKELFQYIKNQETKKVFEEKRKNMFQSEFPKLFSYTDFEINNMKVNPNGKFVTFTLNENKENRLEKMEVFITNDGYNQDKRTKEKVSIYNEFKCKYGIFNVEKDSTYFMDFSKLSHINDLPYYYKEYENLKQKDINVRSIYIGETIFSDDGKWAIVDIRSQDNKSRWILSVDLLNNSFKEIDYQFDEAWIAGPGIPNYSFATGNIGFQSNNVVYFQSEKSGFSHLYLFDLQSNSLIQLTSGNWEVRKAKLSKDKTKFFVTANKNHPGNREFYVLEIENKKLVPILIKDGAHEVEVSPDEKSLLVRYSYKNLPWDLYISELKPNPTLTRITESRSKEFIAYNWKSPEVISFKASDNENVYARIYEPELKIKNGAAILFVHGAGYLQNAHNYWSNYYREYMFHNLLTDLGYTVMDIDYRGSDGYGRKCRTGIYKWMGGKDLSDHMDGKKLLVEKYGIDANRVGIYGGSYGGFITLMALLTKPNEFKCGAALRSVTDWAHYNHGYTSNILNTPETDPIAFKKSSPIYFAENLKDNLLMLHGMIDDNVEYKDIIRLSQRFIELGKKNWELASYPVEAHGFKEVYSWIDEYSRILNLFNTNLLKK